MEGETIIADIHIAAYNEMLVGFPSGCWKMRIVQTPYVSLRCDCHTSLLHHKQETQEDEKAQSALISYGPWVFKNFFFSIYFNYFKYYVRVLRQYQATCSSVLLTTATTSATDIVSKHNQNANNSK